LELLKKDFIEMKRKIDELNQAEMTLKQEMEDMHATS